MARGPPAAAAAPVEALELFPEDDVEDPLGEVAGGSESDSDFEITHKDDGADAAFAQAVGALEDLVISEKFQGALTQFCEKHAHVFVDTEENKLEYMPLFKQYSAL